MVRLVNSPIPIIMCKSNFTKSEKHIVNILFSAHRTLTTKQISEKSHHSWQTSKNNLLSLHEKGYVNKEELGIELLVVENT